MNIRRLKKLRDALHRAEQYRREKYSDQEWHRFEAYWDADYVDVDDERVLTVPTLVSDAQRQKAGLLGGEPRIVVTARTPQKVPGARVLSNQLNHLVRITRLMVQMDEAVQDAQTLGTGFLMDGFGSQYGVHQDTLVEGFDPTRRGGKDNERIEFHDNIHDDLPWTLRAHPADILVPPGTLRIASADEYYHRYIRHIDDVKKDEKLISKHRTTVTADARLADTAESSDRQNMEDYIVLYDHYNLRDNHRVTFNTGYRFALADDVDEILLRINRLNIHPIIFTHASRRFWGTSDFDLLEPQAREINDIRTMMMITRHMEIFKGVYDKDKLTDPDDIENIKKFEKLIMSDIVGALIGIHGSPREFMEFFTPSQPYDFTSQIEMAKGEIREYGMGIGPNQKGQMSSGRHTLGEVKVAEGHYDESMAPRRKIIAGTIIDIVTNWTKLIQDFWIEPRLVQTYDAAGMPVVVEFQGADLEGDFDLTVSLDSMRSRGREEKIEEANMVLSQATPYAQVGIVNPQSLMRQWLTRVTDGDWDIESLMQGQGAPTPQPQSFDKFQQGFNQQVPQNAPSMAAMLGGQGAMQGIPTAGPR